MAWSWGDSGACLGLCLSSRWVAFSSLPLSLRSGNQQPRASLRHQRALCAPAGPRRWVGTDRGSHAAPSPLGETSGSVWVLHSQTAAPSQPSEAPHRTAPPLAPSPWPWLSVAVPLQTVWGQRLTQQPHIRHGSGPLCPALNGKSP